MLENAIGPLNPAYKLDFLVQKRTEYRGFAEIIPTNPRWLTVFRLFMQCFGVLKKLYNSYMTSFMATRIVVQIYT